MLNNSVIDLKNNNNINLNNKLALECSYLINEIKRKNSTLLLPLYITNNKVYLNNKLLSDKKCHYNYKANIKKIISKNIQNKRYHKNLSEDNIFQKKTELHKNNNSISLNSLYNLPKLKTKKKIYLNKNIKVLHSINYNSKSQNDDKVEKGTSVGGGPTNKSSNFLGIENFMKEKFYSDTENKLKNKIKTIYFRNDELIKQKIIFMKKFGIFWRGFIQYCTPIIKLKQYQIDYKNKLDKKNTEYDYNNEKGNINNNSNKKVYNNDENNKINERNKQYSLPKIDLSKYKIH